MEKPTMISQPCPKCHSSRASKLEHHDLSFIQCPECGYDELEENSGAEVRKSQREKSRFSPYKTGGKGRTKNT